MNDFHRTNKVTGVHWLKKPVEDIQIKIKLKHQDGILSLPKFEDYTVNSDNSLKNIENKIEEHIFKWQEKCFCLWELQRYSEPHNCLTDSEMAYNDMIMNKDCTPSKIFTYIHDDYHLPLPVEEVKKLRGFDVPNLNKCMNLLRVDDRIFGEESSSMGHLFRSEEDIQSEEEEWNAMHVCFDNSEYNEDSQLLLKQEAVLLSLYYNKRHGYLIVSPDVNNLDLNPYSVEAMPGIPWGYQYAVEVEWGEKCGGDELEILLKKLHAMWEKKQKQVTSFVVPSLGKKQYYVALEILQAHDFEMDNLYIEFDLKIPDVIKCTDALHGRTHLARSLTVDDTEAWHFGHIVELELEADTEKDLPPLVIFFEVISTDWWGRHRTEGYTHIQIPLEPGHHAEKLVCMRPEELDAVEAESRRFFVGGCHLLKDLEVLTKPQSQAANFKYVTTGNLSIRWSVISQAATAVTVKPEPLSSSAALLRGADAVLRKYKQARARLAAATGAVRDDYSDGDS